MLDSLVTHFDRMLRTLAAPPRSIRETPGGMLPEAALDEDSRRNAAALMRVNHVGEICAQALYLGQSMTSRRPELRAALEQAANEETEHLAWTLGRIRDLGGRTSALNPLWFGGALGIGVCAGLLGDRWNLGFLAETERQVEAHLERHLGLLPEEDERSRAVVAQMKIDEAEHAALANALGAAELPPFVKNMMVAASKLMTQTAYHI